MNTEKKVRPPVVAVMGHIDHGKSSLLDAIRKTNITEGEAGGITQHISAYEVVHEHEGHPRTITFLDTPGHEAFQTMRAHGASIADIAVLVVAADEGVKPQTVEAYKAITEAGIPFVVALSKIDKPDANIERAKTTLLEHEIYLEGLGGSIPYTPVSSKSGEGIPELLDLILLSALLAELSYDSTIPGEGFVLESSNDAKQGIGATLIIKNGTINTGTFVVAGESFAPVRFMENFRGERMKEATASSPVLIRGFSHIPETGRTFTTYATKKDAEKAIEREMKEKKTSVKNDSFGEKKQVPVILKADVLGTIDALFHELKKYTHERSALRILSATVGPVSENDVKNAIASNAVILGFNVKVEGSARDLAERHNIPIETFSIIYELSKRAEEILKERTPRIKVEETLAEAKVLRVFSQNGIKQVIGARTVSGALPLGSTVKIMRREIEIGRGKVSNLQLQRADVSSVPPETEFGAQLDAKVETAPGDILVAFHIVESA